MPCRYAFWSHFVTSPEVAVKNRVVQNALLRFHVHATRLQLSQVYSRRMVPTLYQGCWVQNPRDRGKDESSTPFRGKRITAVATTFCFLKNSEVHLLVQQLVGISLRWPQITVLRPRHYSHWDVTLRKHRNGLNCQLSSREIWCRE